MNNNHVVESVLANSLVPTLFKKMQCVLTNFNPNWFAMTMGTGIVAVALHLIHFNSTHIDVLARDIWLYNIVLFLIFSLTLIARTLIYPQSWRKILRDPTAPLFLSCIPMGLMTILNGAMMLLSNMQLSAVMPFIIGCWWAGVVMSVLCILVVPYLIVTRDSNQLENVSAVWLLPFVACEVAAASGALMLPLLHQAQMLTVLITIISLWSLSIMLSMIILAIFVLRLILHKLPSVDVAASVFLPLGPTSTGALALLLLAKNASALPLTGSTPAVVNFIQILPGIGLVAGMILWAFATWWLAMAVGFTLHYLKNHTLTFSLGSWAYTFPLGVYVLATLNLGKLTNTLSLIVYGDYLGCALIIIWMIVSMFTFRGIFFRDLLIPSPKK